MTITPRFWAGPLRYCRWASRERPALFWSCVVGGLGPVILISGRPILTRLGYEYATPIPMTYPGALPSSLPLCVCVCVVLTPCVWRSLDSPYRPEKKAVWLRRLSTLRRDVMRCDAVDEIVDEWIERSGEPRAKSNRIAPYRPAVPSG